MAAECGHLPRQSCCFNGAVGSSAALGARLLHYCTCPRHIDLVGSLAGSTLHCCHLLAAVMPMALLTGCITPVCSWDAL